MSNTEALPPLPERYTSSGFHDVYTADQMRAYARAALAQAAASGGPVAQYSDIVSDGGFDPRNAAPQPAPARVPLTDSALLDAFCVTPGIHQFIQAFKAGALFAECAHGITPAKEAP